MLPDLRHSLRQLLKTPAFTLTGVLSLTLGIGATTAVFSVIYAILMNPYPYAAPDRMAHMRLLDNAGRDLGTGLTAAQWQTLRKSPVIDDAFASDGWSLTVTGRDLPEDVQADYFTSNAFRFFGVPAAFGRGLLPSDAIDGQDPQPVAVLSYKFWQRHYNSDPSVIGHTIQLVRKTYTVVGVAAPRFTWDDADVYLPLKVTQDPVRAFYVGVRTKPGISLKAASAALQPLMEQFAKETPKHFPEGRFKLQLIGLNDDFEKKLGGTLYLLLAAVGFLLLVGCANASILQLARGTARQGEFALRAAIGAGRSHLIRQMLIEALLLAGVGAGLGILLAYGLTHTIAKLLPQFSFPHEAAIEINLPVLTFSVGLAIVSAILFGLFPALNLSRPDVVQVMQAGSRRIAGNARGNKANTLLVAGQIALTLVMLAGAGAAMRGFLQLLHTPLGYDPHKIMSIGIPVHDGAYPTWTARSAYFEVLRNKIAAVPGVEMAAISTNATPPSNGNNATLTVLGQSNKSDQKMRLNFVSEGYFPILRVPLIRGRIWNETETHNAAHLAVINQTLARRYFPNGDAIGRSIVIPEIRNEPPFALTPLAPNTPVQIVGIVGDKRDDGLRNAILPEAFIPYTAAMRMWTQILVRSAGSPLTLLHAIGKEVNTLDPDQQIDGHPRDLERWIQDQPEWEEEHLVAWLFGAFAILALALAATGLYSVMSFSVQQRTNEFGVRMALGALPVDVLRTVLTAASVSVGLGLISGVVLTLAGNNLLARWAEGSSRDLAVLLAAVALLILVAAAACAIPARRASSVDPMTALRYE